MFLLKKCGIIQQCLFSTLLPPPKNLSQTTIQLSKYILNSTFFISAKYYIAHTSQNYLTISLFLNIYIVSVFGHNRHARMSILCIYYFVIVLLYEYINWIANEVFFKVMFIFMTKECRLFQKSFVQHLTFPLVICESFYFPAFL